MKKLFKKLALMVVALLTFSVGSNYTVKEVRAADEVVATLSFASTAQRTEFSTTKQVWSQNGITFTNNKGSSTTDVANYANPVRLYANSEIVVEAPGNISSIVFTASSSKYATALKNSASGSTVSGSDVTVKLDSTSTTYTVASIGAQVRLSSLTVSYVNNEASEEIVKICEELNKVDSHMSLAYQYKTSQKTINTITDYLNRDSTGIENNGGYKEWSNISSLSEAIYAGQSAGGNDSIQLRSDNNNSGIITTKSGGLARAIRVKWHSGTTSGRVLNIYGSNTAYSNATDLYDSNKQGTLLGTIVMGTSFELSIEQDYAYIGMRSAGKAMYLSEVEIDWETNEERVVTEYSNSKFYLRCGVDTTLSQIANIDSYGIRVSSGTKTVDYSTVSDSWGTENGTTPYYFIVIDLGDIIQNKARLETEFKVCAYIKKDDTVYTSEKVKTYSVVSMVDYYYNEYGSEEVKLQVEHLYNYFVSEDLIKEAN